MFGFEDIETGDSVRFELPKLYLSASATTDTILRVRFLLYEETPG